MAISIRLVPRHFEKFGCFMCEVNFENWQHLFGECPELKKYLEKLGIYSAKDVFNKVKTMKVKATMLS